MRVDRAYPTEEGMHDGGVFKVVNQNILLVIGIHYFFVLGMAEPTARR